MSRRNVEAVVSGAGLVLDIITGLTKEFRAIGGTDEELHRLSRPDGGSYLREMAMAMRGNAIATVVVDYSLSFQELIELGNITVVDDDVTEKKFPIVGVGRHQRQIILLSVDEPRVYKHEETLERLDQLGLRPASFTELLALAAGYPSQQWEKDILIMDPAGEEFRVPSLRTYEGLRRLTLRPPSYWAFDCLAAVPKEK
jgi:hypothetical protein